MTQRSLLNLISWSRCPDHGSSCHPCLNLKLLPLSRSCLLKAQLPISLTPTSLFQAQISLTTMNLWVKQTQGQIPTSRLFSSCATLNKFFWVRFPTPDITLEWAHLGRLSVRCRPPLPVNACVRHTVLPDHRLKGCFIAMISLFRIMAIHFHSS